MLVRTRPLCDLDPMTPARISGRGWIRFVRGLEPVGDLKAHVDGLVDRKRTPCDLMLERLTWHELEDEKAGSST